MSKLKKYRSFFWGSIVIIFSSVIYLGFSSSEEEIEEYSDLQIADIPVEVIFPENQKIEIPVMGKIDAQQKFDIYSEVNGILEKGSELFLSGVSFKKGDIIAGIKSDQFEATLKSDKSSFIAKILSLMATVKYDFSESFSMWNNYLKETSVEKGLPELPQYKSKKERLFFIANGIEELYYKIISQEEQLKKYQIKAPFSGVISGVSVKEGALISAGQKLGSFTGNSNFDIVMDLEKTKLKWISPGDVLLLSDGKKAVISRIGNSIENNTQTVKVYAGITDGKLFDGDYVNGVIVSSKSVNGCLIDRNIVTADGEIFYAQGNLVKSKKINIVSSYNDLLLVTGIEKELTLIKRISDIKVNQKINPVEVKH